MFKKLLVANRGEIALRIMRTCREIGVSTVAVYSDEDLCALHVRYADEAYLLGPAIPRESYLNIERIIALARKCGADALHPGYGFLAENPALADACEAAGITFVGPSGDTMRLLGDKVAARRLAARVGVPLVPGDDHVVGVDEALLAAKRIGYPVLVKAVAGGGGKGIRVVNSDQEMEAALAVAGSEAVSAFGDHALYVEKLLAPVRHVEVQFIADKAGNAVALGERECSIQRRHQKLIEESPSPAVDAALRAKLCEAALAIVKAAEYHSAGTVEFLLDTDKKFYFLEVNTRLQVEHPVTEMVTGTDLIREQLRIAAGESLVFRQEHVKLDGWAIECRIAAEDPWNDFLPSLGRIDFVREPAGPGIRVDSGLYAGCDLPYHYDPMVAKVIAWGRDRGEAMCRMKRALAEFIIIGVRTNIPLHLQLLADERFGTGQVHTRFLETEVDFAAALPGGEEEAALVAAALLVHWRKTRDTYVSLSGNGGGWKGIGRQTGMRGQEVRGSGWRRNTV